MTNGQGSHRIGTDAPLQAGDTVDPYDPAYIYRSIFGSKMKCHRQTWPFIDLGELKSVNTDCVGWIHMDGSPINYPIVKQRFDRGYYLEHNFSGEESVHGQVAMDFALGGQLGDRATVLHAHNMKDWSMFMAIVSLDDPSYLSSHPLVELVLEEGRYTARWFAGVLFPSTDPWPLRMRFDDDADYTAWLQRAKDESTVHAAVLPDAHSRVLVCSTCAYFQEPNDRFAAMAVIEHG